MMSNRGRPCKISRLRVWAAAVVFACVVAAANPAFGFALGGSKWTLNRTVTMHLSLNRQATLSDGFASFNESAADALKIWNQHLVHLTFRPAIGSPFAPGDGDADTSVFFSSNVYGEAFESRVLAVTILLSRNDVLTETDVIFNAGEQWDSYRGTNRAAFDFHRVAIHEFGHVLGLDHPDQNNQNVVAIMNSTVSGIDSLKQDDINGAHALYDSGPAYRSSVNAPALVNLSTRAFVGRGANVVIGGFIVQGSQPATVILRGIGHSLAAQGINNSLTDPLIELRNSAGTVIGSNDDWVGIGDASSKAEAEAIASYRLDPSNSREAALLKTLNPGSYTVLLEAFDNGDGDLTGTGVIELYDLHTTGGRAGNISTRGQVLPDNNAMVAGFIVGGGMTKELVVRGLGPSLQDAGVANTLPNPVLELRDSSGNLLRRNDDWENDPGAAAVQNSGLAPTRKNESALHANLAPGLYTSILRGVDNTTGIGLVEVYDLSPTP